MEVVLGNGYDYSWKEQGLYNLTTNFFRLNGS